MKILFLLLFLSVNCLAYEVCLINTSDGNVNCSNEEDLAVILDGGPNLWSALYFKRVLDLGYVLRSSTSLTGGVEYLLVKE